MLEIQRENVETIINEGWLSFFKKEKNSLFANALSKENASKTITNISLTIKSFLLGTFKTITTFIIFSKIYDKIGMNKFIVLLVSIYFASQYLRGKDEK